jgi:CubicO group peptidase (beta-lactamase class C family)
MNPFREVAVVAALGALCTPALGAPSGHDRHIANIERGLRPAQALAGRRVPVSTIFGEMRRLHVPGVSVAVLDQGRIAWAKGYGVVTPGGAAVTPETLFQAASISKPVAAFGAMTLVQSGKLALEGNVNTYLRSWQLPPGPDGASVSLLQLLSHTGGLSVSGFPGYAPEVPVPTLLQVLDGTAPANTAPVRVSAAPGAAWRYSGGGYTVLQQLMADVAQQDFATAMQARVLQPLGMASSRFSQPADAAILARAALPHSSAGQPYPGGPSTYPELAAAGLWTTPSDLARFALGVQAAVAGHSTVLQGEHAARMLKPVLNGYALGFEVSGSGAATAFAHGGSNRGYQNYLYGFANGGRGAVVMTNGDAGDELARATMRAIAAEYGWPSYQTVMRKAIPIPEQMAQQMAGKYAIPGLGDFDITVKDGQPIFWIKAGQGEPLYRESGTQFFVLSQALALRFDALPGATGSIVAGAFDVRFARVTVAK